MELNDGLRAPEKYSDAKTMYAKYDISLTYKENEEEKTIIVPKGMFVYVRQESLVGLSKIRYNDHEGYVSSSFLDINPPVIEKPKFETTESIKDPTKDYNENYKELTEYYLKSYKSKGLEIIIERFYKNGTVYWVADIKTENPGQQLACAVSHDKYPGKRETTSSIVKRHNGILGINGSGFFYEDNTIFPNVTIKDGQVYKDELGTFRVVCVDDKGNIFACEQGEQAASLLAKGVKNTFGFGPPLIINGEFVYKIAGDYNSGYQPRTAIGMVENGHYVVVVADGRRNYTKGMKITQLASIFKEKKCIYAYNLDGGGSSTLYFNGEVLNNPSDGNERPVVDVIYFKE